MSSMVPRQHPEAAPLTPNQERLWFLHRLDPTSVSYSLPWVLTIRGPLDVDALSRALDRILERHAPLRCRFREIDGEPRMVPQDPEPLDLRPISLDGPDALHDALRAEIAKPLDLADGPILRFALFRLAEDHHALTWTVHHIVYDLSSYNVMLDELEALYPALRDGGEADREILDPLPITYGDYTRRVRERAEQGESEAALDHWKRALSGFEPLELPLDRPRPQRPEHPASTVVRRVGSELTSALRALARERGRSTVFTPTLAAFYVLLRGLSGQDDLVLGVPMAGRDEADVRPLVGFFVDVLALRVDLSDDPSFATLVDRAQDLFLDARRYPQPPLDQLAGELAQNRRAGENPFFPATFQLAREPRAPELPDLEIAQSRLRADNVKFDIRMDVYDRRDHLSLEIEYDTEILDAATIERWFDIYVALLEQAVADPDRPISTLGLLTDGDREVIARANDNATAIPGDVALVEQVRRHVEATPEKIAVVHGERRWSWRELASRADHLAARLAEAGVRPGDFVGLCVERGAELPLGMLGILAAGGAYTSLDPDYPDDRLRFMIDDAGLAVLVVQRHLVEQLPEVEGVRHVLIDESHDGRPRSSRLDERNPEASGSNEDGRSLFERSELCSPPAVEPDAGIEAKSAQQVDGDFPACLIYTSGSTGTPKASVLPQRGVTRLVVGTNYTTFTRDDVFTQTASPSFDAATFEVWGALLHGGTLVVVDREDLLSPDVLGETLQREGATVVFLTTAYFQQVARQAPEVFETPRAIFFGGERCEPDAVRRALDACRRGGTQLFHAYGPSECTTYATCGEVTAVPDDATSVPIGGPVSNTVARVVDPEGRELPVGVAGELWLGGPGLAHAYHDRPRLTAERFVPDPFPTQPGARLYRTGDRVRWLAVRRASTSSVSSRRTRSRSAATASSPARSRRCTRVSIRRDRRCRLVLAREDETAERSACSPTAAPATPLEHRSTEHALGASTLREYLAERATRLHGAGGGAVVLDELAADTPNGKSRPASAARPGVADRCPPSPNSARRQSATEPVAGRAVERRAFGTPIASSARPPTLFEPRWSFSARRAPGVAGALTGVRRRPARCAPSSERPTPRRRWPRAIAEAERATAPRIDRRRTRRVEAVREARERAACSPSPSAGCGSSRALRPGPRRRTTCRSPCELDGPLGPAPRSRGGSPTILRRHEVLRSRYVAGAAVPMARTRRVPIIEPTIGMPRSVRPGARSPAGSNRPRRSTPRSTPRPRHRSTSSTAFLPTWCCSKARTASRRRRYCSSTSTTSPSTAGRSACCVAS